MEPCVFARDCVGLQYLRTVPVTALPAEHSRWVLTDVMPARYSEMPLRDDIHDVRWVPHPPNQPLPDGAIRRVSHTPPTPFHAPPASIQWFLDNDERRDIRILYKPSIIPRE